MIEYNRAFEERIKTTQKSPARVKTTMIVEKLKQ
jgi:hypothetical protein